MPKHLLAGNCDRTCTQPSRIEIHYEPIESLKPDPKNARKHSKRQLRQLARSIGSFDFNVPTVAGYTGEPAYHAVTGRSFDETASTLGGTNA
jgi:hypothetical protein